MKRSNLCIILSDVIKFLVWKERYRLLQVCREARSLTCSEKFELEAFLHIAQVYNCHIEAFDTDEDGVSPYYTRNFRIFPKLSCDVLNIRTWIGALIRIERLYAKYATHNASALPVGDQKWIAIEDEELDLLIKRRKFLSGGFVVGCPHYGAKHYLDDFTRFRYPDGKRFDIEHFLTLEQREKFLILSSAAQPHCRSQCQWETFKSIPDPLVQRAVRLIHIDEAGMFTTNRRGAAPNENDQVTCQPYITRAVMEDTEIFPTYIVKANCPPYAFTRWLTGLYVQPETNAYLASRNGHAPFYLRKHSEILDYDVSTFWKWPAGAGTRSESQENHKSHKDKRRAHYDYVTELIARHLGKVCEPFTTDDIKTIKSAYCAHGLELTENGDRDRCWGSYLEVMLSDYVSIGPHPDTLDHIPTSCVLYIGPSEAVLHTYANLWC